MEEEAFGQVKFKDFTDEMMKEIRIKEQEKAAEIGRYNKLYLLGYPSKEIKDKNNEEIVNDYIEIIRELKPRVIYTHSILDKHPTHIGVALKVIEALRGLSKEYMPEEFYGCEVWRGLGWISDGKEKILNGLKRPFNGKMLTYIECTKIDI